MSITEILDELPNLQVEERELILHRIEELDEASPEMLAAIDEADASPREKDIPVEELYQRVKEWAHTK